MATHKKTGQPSKAKKKKCKESKPTGLAAYALLPPLSESWLNGSLPPMDFGLRNLSFPGGGDLRYESLFYAVHEARRVMKDQTEEYVRAVWILLDAIFELWFAKNHILKNKPGFAKSVSNLGIYTHYDLYHRLRKEQYPPLVASKVPKEHLLAALVLHDCANGLSEDVAGAAWELTCTIGYDSAVTAGVKAAEEIQTNLMELVSPGLKALSQQKKNLKKGPPNGAAANRKRSEQVTSLFRAIDRENTRNHPAWSINDRVLAIKEWAKKYNVTKNGKFGVVTFNGEKYEVPCSGTEPYTDGGIMHKIKGQKKQY